MRKLMVLAATAVLGMTAGGVNVAGAGDERGASVTLRGDTFFSPNSKIESNYQFHDGDVDVMPGGMVSWTDQTLHNDFVHTVTIVDHQPRTIEELFACGSGAPDDPCAVASDHFGEGGIANPVLNRGGPGFDTVGDSVVVFPGQSVTETITAAPGTTLLYMCVIHPWMQGSIEVG